MTHWRNFLRGAPLLRDLTPRWTRRLSNSWGLWLAVAFVVVMAALAFFGR